MLMVEMKIKMINMITVGRSNTRYTHSCHDDGRYVPVLMASDRGICANIDNVPELLVL